MTALMVQLVVLLFLGSTVLIRRAQNELYNHGEENPLHGLFQFQAESIAGTKGAVDEVSFTAHCCKNKYLIICYW